MKKKFAFMAVTLVMAISCVLPTFAVSVEKVAPRMIEVNLENIDYLMENEKDSSDSSTGYSEYIAGKEKVEEVEFRNISFNEEDIDYLTESEQRWIKVPSEVFDWSKGEYSFEAEFSNSVGTKVLFTGSSTYYVNIAESWEFKDGKNQYDKSNVSFIVECHEASTNETISSYIVSGTGSTSLCFSGLDTKKSYWFVFKKNTNVMGTDSSVDTHGTISLG